MNAHGHHHTARPRARDRAAAPVRETGRPAIDFRRARREELWRIVRLLADDPLGRRRERFEVPLPEAYLKAFEAIDADPNQELVVARVDGRVAGVLQLTYLPCLTHVGRPRALIEGVRVDRRLRSRGLGRALFDWAIGRARERGCGLVQLTTDKRRPRAKRFYEALGFHASHEGMKLAL